MADHSPKEYKDVEYIDLKREFGNYYQGEDYKKLRFCLCDHLPIGDLAKSDNVGNTLINMLEKKVYFSFSPTEVSLLWEIAMLTQVANARRCVCKYLEAKNLHNPDTDKLNQEEEKNGLREYRKVFYKALEQVGEDELPGIKAYYNVTNLDLPTLWDVVFHLEKEEWLNTKKKLMAFGKSLHKVARTTLADGIGALIPETEDKLDQLVRKDQVCTGTYEKQKYVKA